MPFRSRPTGVAASARVIALLGEPVERPAVGGWTPKACPDFPEDLLWTPPPYDPAEGWPTAPPPTPALPREGDWLPSAVPKPEEPLEGPTSLVGMLRAGRWDPSRRGAIALALLGVVAALIAAVVLLRARPSEQPLTVPPLTGTAASSAGPQVVIDVAGKVRRPGLVRLPAGSRVNDALNAAGGVLPGASTVTLNLARRVTDGEQVLVGEVPVVGAGGASGGLLDLNLAAATDFEQLPGIGPVLAERIVAWRTEHGGRFASIDQLREVSGIGESKYQSLKSKVRV